MAAIREADILKLLNSPGLPILKDRGNSEDYSFLAETVLPTLLPGLVSLQDRLEASESTRGEQAANGVPPLNATRWLAEYLIRHHPRDGVFTDRSVYSNHLNKTADVLKEQRLEREKVRLDRKRREEEENIKRDLERTAAEEKSRKEVEELRTRAYEATLNEKNRKGEKAAIDAIGIDKAPVILTFRSRCMKMVNRDYRETTATNDIEMQLFQEACKMLVSNSAASFAAAVSLADTDTLHFHTAANKIEFPLEEEEDDNPGPREQLPPEITIKELPPLADDSAYTLKRGFGISWSVIDETTPKLISDTKYTENMVFFDGEKRKGTYLAVPLLRENRIAGMLCADTLDSTTGAELCEADFKLYTAVSVVLSECLDKAGWLLTESRRQICTEKLRQLAADPSTLPEQMCVAIVDAIDAIAPGCLVSVGMMDTAMVLRLVHRSKSDNTKESDKVVTIKDKGKDIPAIFQCFQVKSTCSTKNDKREIDTLTVPVLDEDKLVSAAIYIANDHLRNRLADKENVDFIENVAQLVAPVLLNPQKAAIRRLKVLAESSLGDSTALFELAISMCQRYAGASEVFIAMAHGADRMRVVKSSGGWYASGAIIEDREKPGCFEAMRTADYHSPSTDYVAAPLTNQTQAGKVSFGVICLKISFLDSEQQVALQGVAQGLSSALKESEWRRKMAVCGRTALQSLLKRATCIKSAYLAFLDVKTRQVCAVTIGDGVAGVEVGKILQGLEGFHTAWIASPLGGPPVGLIGAAADVTQDERMARYDESAWDVLADCADTMGHVSDVIFGEGVLADITHPGWQEAEHMLETHFKAARFDLVTEQTVKGAEMRYMDKIKSAASPHPVEMAVTQSIMYILGHQQRDVSEWPKCRKLLTHHVFKEMRMIDIRGQLKVHKLKLASSCIAHLSASEIRQGPGQQCVLLWNWVRMVLDVQGLE